MKGEESRKQRRLSDQGFLAMRLYCANMLVVRFFFQHWCCLWTTPTQFNVVQHCDCSSRVGRELFNNPTVVLRHAVLHSFAPQLYFIQLKLHSPRKLKFTTPKIRLKFLKNCHRCLICSTAVCYDCFDLQSVVWSLNCFLPSILSARKNFIWSNHSNLSCAIYPFNGVLHLSNHSNL